MLIAHDEKGNRVSIDRVRKEEKYFCPICSLGLTVKNNGKIRKPHFAHKIGSDCDWGDMSEWHISWQEKFPEENQEVIIENNGIKHRADVLIPSANTVIEFQHSPISAEEFNARNQFYTDCGYKLVWVFDATERIRPLDDDSSLETLSFDYRVNTWNLIWNRKKTTFKDFETINRGRNISILLDVKPKNREKILYIVKTIGVKCIDVYSIYEPIREQNLLRTYGILKDRSILTFKQMSVKTNQIIETEMKKEERIRRKRIEDNILKIGVRKYFYDTRGLKNYPSDNRK